MQFKLNPAIQATQDERKNHNKWTVVTRAILILLMVQILLGVLGALISLTIMGPDQVVSLESSQATPFDIYFSLYGQLVDLIAMAILVFYVERRSTSSLGLESGERNSSKYLALSGYPLLVFLLTQIFGQVQIQLTDKINVWALLALILGFFIRACAQELIFRSYILTGLSVDGRVNQAIGVTALIQTALHLFSPNFSVAGLVNVFLLSVILSLVFYFTSNVKVTILIHFISQSLLGPLLGGTYQASPLPQTLWTSLSESGGHFAFDQSGLTSIVLLVITIILFVHFQSFQVNDSSR